MIELKPWDEGHKSTHIKAFALEKGDSSVPKFPKMEYSGERIKGVVELTGVRFSCKKCHTESDIDKLYYLTDERVRVDSLNDVLVGNAFMVCPVCQGKKFIWGKDAI